MKLINKKIDMITWSDKDGKMKPMRFRYEDDEEMQQVVKVDTILSYQVVGTRKDPILSYNCKSLINDMEKIYEVRFDVNKMMWTLYKM